MDNFEQSEKKPNAFLNYITENGDSIKKLFINHIGMMIFGLVVLITAKLMSSKLGSDWAFYAMGALTVLMYFSLIYTAMWERGAKDKIRLDGGRLKRNVFNGLYFYLIGNAVAIISGFICLLLSFLLTDEVSFVNNVYGVFRIISHYYSSMYLPLTTIEGMSAVVSSLVHIGVILPGAAVAFASYNLGLNGHKCIFPEPKHDQNRKMR